MTWKPADSPIDGEEIASLEGASVVQVEENAYLVTGDWSFKLDNLKPHLGLWADDDGGPDVALAREPECYICVGPTVTVEGMTAGDYSATYLKSSGESYCESRFVDGGDAEFHEPDAVYVYVLRTSR